MNRRATALAFLSLLTPACSPAADDGAPLPAATSFARPRCQAPSAAPASPRTIEEATELLNALPKPTTVACFVESLARPLAIHATASVVSAQPAESASSPRVFIHMDRLWLSIAVDGKATNLLEFSYQLPDDELYSLKGELELPLAAVVPASAPYDHVRATIGTKCRLCHRNETQLTEITFAEAFASAAIRPFPAAHVTVDTLRAESAACDGSVTPHRCEMLSALFDGGPVSEASFPAAWPTFF